MKVTVHKFFIGATAALGILLCTPNVLPAQNKSHGVKTIVIDPGHGGKDSGCAWGSVYEKDIVLSVGLLLGDMIKKNLPDVKVLYTRDKDVFIGLSERGDLANKVGADLFISIHVNSVPAKSTAPSGAETYVMGAHKAKDNLDVAMRENDVIMYESDYKEKYQGYQPGSPESFIIFSLMQYVNTDQSINLAQAMQNHYTVSKLFPNRGVKQAGYLVLWQTAMPSILTEIGFLPNAADRALITSASGQKKIASSIFNAISEYKAKTEGNSKPVVLDIASMQDDDASSPSVTQPSQTSASSVSSTTGTTTSTPSDWTFSADAVVYRVQVGSTPNRMSMESSTLKPFKGNVTERKVGNLYKYYVGCCSTYESATELQSEVRKRIKDAFLVAFDGDKQITITEARKLTR